MLQWLFFVFAGIEGYQLTWTQDTGVRNKANWKDDKTCRGLVFDSFNRGGQIALESLVISEVMLPLDGDVIINDGSTIVFDEYDRKCISLKPVTFLSWLDPDNWKPDAPNAAVPYAYRVPCGIHDVVMPKGASFAISDAPDAAELDLRSFGHEGKVARLKSCWNANLECLCDVSDASRICSRRPARAEPKCEKPLWKDEFCTPFCGVKIILRNRDVAQLTDFLARHADDVDHFVAARIDGGASVYVADRDGSSGGYYAVGLLAGLSEALAGRGDAVVLHSGDPLRTGFAATAALAVAFGALLLAALFFAAVFAAYEHPGTYAIWGKRAFVFARFENKDDGVMTFETRQPAEQQKSFDNPLYGKLDDEEVAADGPRRQKSFSNPLYGRSDSEAATSLVDGDDDGGDGVTDGVAECHEPGLPLVEI